MSLTIVPTSCSTSSAASINPSATLLESSEQRKFGQLSVAGSSTCMEGRGLIAHTDPVQSGPAVNDMCDKASGSENLGIVGSQSSGGSGSIPQGEALMDAGVVLGQATHEVRISQNSCLVPSHIPIRLSREEILSVSPHSMCMRPNYPNCMIWDGIVYNFGPDSDKDADPSGFFPLNLLSPPNPNNNIESALFEVPINIGPIESAQSSPSYPANTQKIQSPSSVSIPNISIDSSLKKSSQSPNLKRKPIPSKLKPSKKKSKTILASQNPVSYPTSSPSTSHSDEHGPVLEGNPISLEISSQISINPHQDSHLFSMAEEAGLTMPPQVP
ncbi:hypothetical protein FCV25MIE_15818 [Fagus crenata]